MKYNYEIVATGDKWMGYGVKTTSRAVDELIDKSEKSLLFTIYIITDKNILKKIIAALERGVNVEVFLYRGEEFDQQGIASEISKLEKKYENFKVYIGSSDEFIHSKVLISDKHSILIGSANLTSKGLSSNYELGILIDDEDVSFKVESIIKKLRKG